MADFTSDVGVDYSLRSLACSRPQIILSWVCQQWRDIILNSPLLWRNIDYRHEPFPFVRAQKYLIRSQQVDLHVALNSRSKHQSFPNELAHMIGAINTALPYFNQWGKLCLSVTDPQTLLQGLYAMTNTGGNNAHSRLKTLLLSAQVKGPAVPLRFDEESGKYWQAKLASIQVLGLKGVTLPWQWTNLFRGLTNLVIYMPPKASSAAADALVTTTSSNFLTLLQGCPQLEQLKLMEIRFVDPPAAANAEEPETPSVATLNHLRVLMLQDCHQWTIYILLDMIACQNLETFILNKEDGNVDHLDRLVRFTRQFDRQNARLKTFRLSLIPGVVDNNLISLFHCLRTVESISLATGLLTRQAWRALTPTDDSVAACPRLKKLRIASCSISFCGLYTMVTARAARVVNGVPNPIAGPLEQIDVINVTSHESRSESIAESMNWTVEDMWHALKVAAGAGVFRRVAVNGPIAPVTPYERPLMEEMQIGTASAEEPLPVPTHPGNASTGAQPTSLGTLTDPLDLTADDDDENDPEQEEDQHHDQDQDDAQWNAGWEIGPPDGFPLVSLLPTVDD